MRGWCERAGSVRIGFGDCRGTVLPALTMTLWLRIMQMNTTTHTNTDDTGTLVLRAALAMIIASTATPSSPAASASLAACSPRGGLPEALGYLVHVGEVIAPCMILAGVFTRPAALVVAMNMIVAVLLVLARSFSRLTKLADGRWSCRGCSSSLQWLWRCWGQGVIAWVVLQGGITKRLRSSGR